MPSSTTLVLAPVAITAVQEPISLHIAGAFVQECAVKTYHVPEEHLVWSLLDLGHLQGLSLSWESYFPEEWVLHNYSYASTHSFLI